MSCSKVRLAVTTATSSRFGPSRAGIFTKPKKSGSTASKPIAPDHFYKIQNLVASFVQERGLFMRPSNKGRFYHDGRFATLLDVVNHYNMQFNLGLSVQEKLDLVGYLKSL